MNEREQILQHLQQLADGISAMFGKDCETCIHDLQDLHCSLIYINGTVTGRSLGAPATDLLVKALRQPSPPEDIHNYRTTAADGRALKSTTIFIRDHRRVPVFAFCINYDTTAFFNARQALLPFLEEGNSSTPIAETFSRSPQETIEALFRDAVLEIGKQPATMSTAERTRLVELLETSGVFQFKGAVEQIALLSGVSKYTIYNYLKKIHARQAFNQLG